MAAPHSTRCHGDRTRAGVAGVAGTVAPPATLPAAPPDPDSVRRMWAYDQLCAMDSRFKILDYLPFCAYEVYSYIGENMENSLLSRAAIVEEVLQDLEGRLTEYELRDMMTARSKSGTKPRRWK